MIRIGMCDDEIEIAQSIAIIINEYCKKFDFNAKVCIISDNQDEIFEKIDKKEIDVLILDIDFKNGGKNGLDFAADLRAINKDFYLIFLSAHSRFIHNSMIYKTYDYLVKPLHENVISELILRLKEEFEEEKKLFMHVNKSLSIRTDQILYIEKQRNKAIIYTKNDEYETIGSINDILDLLPKNFKKCHRSYIVNENKIITIDKKSNSLLLENNRLCPTSEKYTFI